MSSRSYPERDDAWLDMQRRRLMSWPRENLLTWLAWNDRNGCYHDRDLEEGMDPWTQHEAVEAIMRYVAENRETPEEMRMASWRR